MQAEHERRPDGMPRVRRAVGDTRSSVQPAARDVDESPSRIAAATASGTQPVGSTKASARGSAASARPSRSRPRIEPERDRVRDQQDRDGAGDGVRSSELSDAMHRAGGEAARARDEQRDALARGGCSRRARCSSIERCSSMSSRAWSRSGRPWPQWTRTRIGSFGPLTPIAESLKRGIRAAADTLRVMASSAPSDVRPGSLRGVDSGRTDVMAKTGSKVGGVSCVSATIALVAPVRRRPGCCSTGTARMRPGPRRRSSSGATTRVLAHPRRFVRDGDAAWDAQRRRRRSSRATSLVRVDARNGTRSLRIPAGGTATSPTLLHLRRLALPLLRENVGARRDAPGRGRRAEPLGSLSVLDGGAVRADGSWDPSPSVGFAALQRLRPSATTKAVAIRLRAVGTGAAFQVRRRLPGSLEELLAPRL